MTRREIRPAAGQPVDINTVSLSPNVAVYRLWFKPVGGKYGPPIKTGDTDDNEPDTLRIETMPPSSSVGYFVAISGRKAIAPYRVLLTFSQGGAALSGGHCLHEGNTDANGYAEVWGEVVSV